MQKRVHIVFTYNMPININSEVRFASIFSSGFITAIVVNPQERKLAKGTSVHCVSAVLDQFLPWFKLQILCCYKSYRVQRMCFKVTK